MKREIKFRGKRIDNGEWVHGCLTRYSEEMSYITVDLTENKVYEVSTKTVGQFTGLQDKNRKDIYEGDRIHYSHNKICSDGSGIETITVGAITVRSLEDFKVMDSLGQFDELTIIKNIHDNPELLGVGL